MNTDTPRTNVDVESYQFESYSNQLSYRTKLARQLERELNEAKRLAGVYSNDSMLFQAQRDQWRAMAQELAHCIQEGNAHGYGLRIGDDALARFNELSKQG